MFPSISPEKITHWTTIPDGYGGFTFSAPVVLEGKWEDIAELFTNENGETETSEAIVYLDTDVSNGDYLFQGESEQVDPTSVSSHRVKRFRRVTDIRRASTERKAWL